MMGMNIFIGVALGGAVGSLMRAGLSYWMVSKPLWAVSVVNLLGALMIGGLSKWSMQTGGGDFFRAFWIVGICGGFTTFSAFGWDLFSLLQRDAWAEAILYASTNFLGTLLFIWIGFRLVS